MLVSPTKEIMSLSRGETCLYERLSFLWLWSEGLSVRSIARLTGRSPHTVRRWLRWWGRYTTPRESDSGQQYLLPGATNTTTELPLNMTHSDLSSSLASLSPRWTAVPWSTWLPSLHGTGFVHSGFLCHSTCGVFAPLPLHADTRFSDLTHPDSTSAFRRLCTRASTPEAMTSPPKPHTATLRGLDSYLIKSVRKGRSEPS